EFTMSILKKWHRFSYSSINDVCMRIEKIKALWGPNYWSIKKHHLIVMLLDLEDLEERPTNTIPGFHERIKKLIPSLYNHRCSEGVPGGFFKRVEDGTWMGHVIEHMALEIQSLAGMSVGFGQTRSADRKGVYHVVFSYEVKEAGVYAAYAAVRIAEALIEGKEYDLNEDINRLKGIRDQKKLGPSTNSIVQAAINRGIPAVRLDQDSYVQLGYGSALRSIEASIASTTSLIGVELAGDKHRTKSILSDSFVPVPEGVIITDVEKLQDAVQEIGFPIVVKPLDGNQGKGATTNITTIECARDAFHRAQEISRKVIVERFITGRDFRALVINYKFVAAAMRTPAAVVGDGQHTIRELIDRVNEDPRRGNGHCNILTKIHVDQDTREILSKNQITLDAILPEGQELWLKSTANLSTGGTSEDVTDMVHPSNVSLFERIARIMNLDICGIDVMTTDISLPLLQTNGAVIEVNAAPGLRMHLEPTSGKPRNVAEPIIDMLFPNGSTGRIPLVAVTGTNGKTTTTRLIANMAQQMGHNTGFTTTDGIYINKELIYKGDCSGPASAQVVLRDPSIEFAVLECARGGILRSGLGFDRCHCAVVTNVAEDHLGMDGIDTVEKLARVKSVVPETASKDGYAVLNADDDLVYAMKDQVVSKVALFSLYPDNIRIQRHCDSGGIAAVFEEGYIIIREGNRMMVIDEVENIPITYGGKARFNVANVMAATLAAYLSKISLPAIRSTLRNFRTTPEQAPGRMNEFNFGDFTMMVDYAHNAHGLKAMGEFVKAMPATKKVAVIAGVGDRRNQDIIAVAEEAARTFDEIVIRMDKDLRGRTELELGSLLRSGIHRAAPDKKVTYFSDEMDAIDHVVRTAETNSFTVIFVENIAGVCNRLQQHLNDYKMLHQNIKSAV
ncbi:MAG TPA: cyanophycin synthetase, partial [Chitinophagaceae bacterium]|nr:cyanophycin synthetase [Chitinophagaceae bacterium]